jgi:hypothetical protein
MDKDLTRSQKFGIQWRWLFLIGGVIYAYNCLRVIFIPQEGYDFLGLEMDRWIYFTIQCVISSWLLWTFFKHRKLLKSDLKKSLRKDLNT